MLAANHGRLKVLQMRNLALFRGNLGVVRGDEICAMTTTVFISAMIRGRVVAVAFTMG